MKFRFSITRGDDRSFTITATTPDRQPYSLTDKTVWFSAKLSQSDVEAVIAKKTGEGITVLSEDHKARVFIDAEDTAELPGPDAALICDVQIRDSSGKTFTPADGDLGVKADITRF